MMNPAQTLVSIPRNSWAKPKLMGVADKPLCETIIAIDPGGTTGWALFSFKREAWEAAAPLLPNISYWTFGQLVGDEDDQIDSLVDMATAWPHATFVIEDFHLKQLAGGKALLAPVRITAGFANRFRWTGPSSSSDSGFRGKRKLYKQMPGLALPAITDERLKLFGFWDCTKGKDHARDAIRHALMFARRKKEGLLFDK